MTVKMTKKVRVIEWKKLVFLFFFVSVLSYGQQAEKLQNKLLSKLYFRNAVQEYDGKKIDSALRLLDVALSFDNEVSDSHYLRAKILWGKKQYVSARAEVETALLNHNWNYYNDIEGRVLLAEIQYRLGDAGAAYINLLPYKAFITGRPETAELFLKIERVLGKNKDAVTIARSFPQQGFAQQILAEEDPQWRSLALSRITQQKSGNLVTYYTKEALQQLIVDSSKDTCTSLLRYYKKRWGKDRFYYINSLCFTTVPVKKILDMLFVPGNTITRREINRIKMILDTRNVLYDAAAYFSSKSFTITDDLNNDGIVDMVTSITDGMIQKVRYDKNQDGNPDYIIGCKGGKIMTLKIRASAFIDITFLSYPYVGTYRISRQNKTRKYSIVPYALTLPLVLMPKNAVLEPVSINAYIKLPSTYTLEDCSSAFTENDRKDSITIQADRISSDNTLVSFLNSKGVILRKREYRGTQLQKQTEDINGDGVPDLFFTYHQGTCATMAYDGNNNGHPEYVEEYYPNKMTKWDFNDDGIFDFKEYMNGSTRIEEFSTKMDGVFNLKIEKMKTGEIHYIYNNKDVK